MKFVETAPSILLWPMFVCCWLWGKKVLPTRPNCDTIYILFNLRWIFLLQKTRVFIRIKIWTLVYGFLAFRHASARFCWLICFALLAYSRKKKQKNALCSLHNIHLHLSQQLKCVKRKYLEKLFCPFQNRWFFIIWLANGKSSNGVLMTGAVCSVINYYLSDVVCNAAHCSPYGNVAAVEK